MSANTSTAYFSYLTYFSYLGYNRSIMYKKKLYGTATVGTKGQVVIPADAREELNIEPGDRLYVVGSCDMKWIGFLKEEQLRGIVEHITEGLENFNEQINSEGFKD